MKNKIIKEFRESIETKNKTISECIEDIKLISELIINTLKNNNKLLICGNGGSAADSQHFATELMVRFEKERRSLPAISLTTDTSNITACGNDYNFDNIFKRQISSLGNKGDLLIGFSTSGNSKNIINAVLEAQSKGLKVIIFSGKDGGKLKKMDIKHFIKIPSDNTARIQETHITIIHIICKLIDDNF